MRHTWGGGRILDLSVPSALLDRNRKIMSAFFQILVDRLHHFQAKPPKWQRSSPRLPKVNDIVLFTFTDSKIDPHWKIGRIVEAEQRSVTIMYATRLKPNAMPTMSTVKRSPRQVVIIFSENELRPNSSEYFAQFSKPV